VCLLDLINSEISAPEIIQYKEYNRVAAAILAALPFLRIQRINRN
jgi:hypothetical protein